MNGITSLASLSKAAGQPGQPINPDEFAAWVRSLEPAATIGGVANLRRLTCESQTQLLAILRESVTSPDGATRKVPQAERESRMTLLKNRLPGLLVEGANEPGHALLGAVMSMVDKNQLRYLGPDRCISRIHELTSQKTTDRMLEIEANRVVVKDKDDPMEVPARTSLQVLEALRRRGVVLEYVDCVSFNQHEKYIQALFGHVHREPPPGFQRTTVTQLVTADKEAWKRVIEQNIKPKRDFG